MRYRSLYKLLICLAFTASFALFSVACISQKPGVDSPNDIIHYPLGIAIHPEGRYAAIVNSDFNQAYRNGSLVIIDLSTYTIVGDWTMPIGMFGGEVIFNHAGTRVFVAVRGEFKHQGDLADEPEDVIIVADVDLEVAKNAPSKNPSDKPFFIEGSRRAISVSPDPFGLSIDADDRYLYISHISNGELTVLKDDTGRTLSKDEQDKLANGETIKRCLPINQDCSGFDTSGTLCGTCDSPTDCGFTEAVMAGSLGGVPLKEANSCLENPRNQGRNFCATFCEVDKTEINADGETVRLGCPDGFYCEQLGEAHVETVRKFSRGGNQIAISPTTGTVYLSQRDSNALGILRPYWASSYGYMTRIEQITFSEGYDQRGLAFEPDGSKLYVASRNEGTDTVDGPGILVMDTTLAYEDCLTDQFIGDSSTCEKNEIIDFIEVTDKPANIALINNFLYVVSYSRDQIYVIDLVSRQAIKAIDLAPAAFIEKPGIYRADASPYDIETYENKSGIWALVSDFKAHEIAVIHLFDEDGNQINQVERKIENRAKLYEDDQF